MHLFPVFKCGNRKHGLILAKLQATLRAVLKRAKEIKTVKVYFGLLCLLLLPIFSGIEFPKMEIEFPLGNTMVPSWKFLTQKFYRKGTHSALNSPSFPKVTDHEIFFFFSFSASTTFCFEHLGILLGKSSWHY